jgi:hypothetical protein
MFKQIFQVAGWGFWAFFVATLYVATYGLSPIDEYMYGIQDARTVYIGQIIDHLDEVINQMEYNGMTDDKPTVWGTSYGGVKDSYEKLKSMRRLAGTYAGETSQFEQVRDVAGLKYLASQIDVGGTKYVLSHNWIMTIDAIFGFLWLAMAFFPDKWLLWNPFRKPVRINPTEYEIMIPRRIVRK